VKRWNGPAEVPAPFGPAVVTFGIFDGVHRGHRAVLARVVERAAERGEAAVAVTFDPHPSTLHNPAGRVPALAGLDRRLNLLAEAGLDAVLTVGYTPEFAAISAEAFAADYLARLLGARVVVVGRDVQFGRGKAGDLATLAALGEALGFAVEAVGDVGDTGDSGDLGHIPLVGDPAHPTAPARPSDPAQPIGPGDRNPRWSSTQVRALLADGDVEEAARLLGRAHRVVGTVVRGDGRGRGLGFPTANLGGLIDGMIPADGVYAGWLTRLGLAPGEADQRLPAALSVGRNPTFSGTDRRLEAHVPGRTDLELYGEVVAVDFTVRLRRTLAFATVEALKAQMGDDVRAAVAALRARRA
jgi:riboflavin kinase/FMN adenylyltransferase